MEDFTAEAPTDASAATDSASWLGLMTRIGDEEGFFQAVGSRHWAFFVDDSPTLLVSFETLEQVRARPGQMPLAHDLAAAKGWSHLCLISDGQTWFRDDALYAHFDGLVDDAYFEDFDRVLFYGAGPQSYAACAFAVAAPGARVLALNPVATLDPARAGWDDRYRHDRRRDFTSRYGYAPDMVDGSAQVTVLYDPALRAEAMHAALFRSSFAQILPLRFAGADLEQALFRMGVLRDVVIAAMEGTLSPAGFAGFWRKRRNDAIYLKSLLQVVAATGKRQREIWLCSNVATRLNSNRFRKRLSDLTAKTRTKT